MGLQREDVTIGWDKFQDFTQTGSGGRQSPMPHLQVDLQPLVVHFCLKSDEVQLLSDYQRGLGQKGTP